MPHATPSRPIRRPSGRPSGCPIAAARRRVALALPVLLALLLPAPAAAQDDLPDVRTALERLADGLNGYFSRNNAELSAERPAIWIQEMTDADTGIACQPLSDDGRDIFRDALSRQVVRFGLPVSLNLRQGLGDGDRTVLLKYSVRGGRIDFKADIGRSTEGGFQLDDFAQTSARTASLDAESRRCATVDDSRHAGLTCTAARALSLRTGFGRFGDQIRQIERRERFEVLASYGDGAALLVETAVDDGYGGRDLLRGFVPGRLEALIRDGVIDCDGFVPERARLQPLQPHRDCETCPAVVLLPRGIVHGGSARFEAGREDDEDDVAAGGRIVDGFAIGLAEVTHGEWQACVEAGACAPRAPGVRPDLPVAVGLAEARGYLEWLSRRTGATYRLPSELEWTYAARGDGRSRYHWGDLMRPGAAVCRTCTTGPAPGEPAPATGGLPNAFGLYHVHGNLAEWTGDCLSGAGGAVATLGAVEAGGACARPLIKGGSYRDGAMALRVGNRNHGAPDRHDATVGLRVLREP